MNAVAEDVSAEQAVLGSILLDPEAIHEVSGMLTPEDFADRRHALIWQAMAAAVAAGQPIDDVLIAAELRRRGTPVALEYLGDLSVVTPTAANVRYYAQSVVERAAIRRLLDVQRAINTGVANGAKADELVATAQAAVTAAVRRHSGRRDEWSAAEAAADWWEWMAEGPGPMGSGVPTGFPALDSALCGLHPGQLVILGARPAVGKSAMALNIAHAAAEAGHRVALFSLEMSARSLWTRLVAMESGVNSHRMRTGRTGDDDVRIAQANDRLTRLPLHVLEASTPTVDGVAAKVRRLIGKEGPVGLVIVDYLQLLAAGDRKRSRVEQVSELSAGLKHLAVELGLPVVALSQLSRETEHSGDGVPRLYHLRESGSLEQDADVVLLLHRARDKVTQRLHSATTLQIAKNREGGEWSIQLVFDGATTRFRSGGL